MESIDINESRLKFFSNSCVINCVSSTNTLQYRSIALNICNRESKNERQGKGETISLEKLIHLPVLRLTNETINRLTIHHPPAVNFHNFHISMQNRFHAEGTN